MSLLQIYEPNQSPDPHHRAPAVGIDLGTTNSVVACMKGDAPIALPDSTGNTIIPSALFYDEEGNAFVGKHAFEAAAKQGMYPWQSIKRLMGKSAAETVSHLPVLADTLIDNASALPTFRLCGVEKNPITMSADILTHLRHLASDALEDAITQAVITVPAYFDDAARHATRQAAEIAGFEVLRLINEPTAAALAYGLEHGRDGIYAVYDLGGGTFDISILNLEEGVFQVLATAGDTSLGGDDIDAAIARHLRQEYGLDNMEEPALLNLARQLKEMMGDKETITLPCADTSIKLTSATLRSLAEPLIARSLQLCGQALEDANISHHALQGVVLVGGSTRLHAIKQAVKEYFSCTIYDDVDPDRVVAYGAAIQAHALQMGAEHLLLDVVPLSLGVETMGGIVEKIIYRNSPIPAHATHSFTTYADGQTGMQFHVLQGERELVEQCRSLAQFELVGIPPLPAGVARVEVSFVVDASGLLTVSAQEIHTGIKQTVHVTPSYGLEFADIERMILESMEHGRDDIMTRLLIETRIEAQRTLEETRSALAQDAHLLNETELRIITTAVEGLHSALHSDSSTRDAIISAHETLNHTIAPFAEKRMNAAIMHALHGQHIRDVK
jgi:molecular chaperone HscA